MYLVTIATLCIICNSATNPLVFIIRSGIFKWENTLIIFIVWLSHGIYKTKICYIYILYCCCLMADIVSCLIRFRSEKYRSVICKSAGDVKPRMITVQLVNRSILFHSYIPTVFSLFKASPELAMCKLQKVSSYGCVHVCIVYTPLTIILPRLHILFR